MGNLNVLVQKLKISPKILTNLKTHLTTKEDANFVRNNSVQTWHVYQVHEKKKNHMCKVCHKSFVTTRDLWVHSSAVHDKSKTFKCKSCEKTFSQKGNMKTHYETQHLGIRNFKCNFCGETFTQNQYLQNHLKRNHKDKTKPLVIKIKKCNI